MRATAMNLARILSVAAIATAIVLPTASLAAQGEQTSPPAPAAPHSVKFPVPVEKTLPNGLRVIAIERAGMPLVTAQLMIRSGGEVDPSNLSGLADVTAALLTKGTARRTAPEIAEAIDALGGSLTSDAQWDVSSATVTVTAVANVALTGQITFDRVPFNTTPANGLDFTRVTQAPARGVVSSCVIAPALRQRRAFGSVRAGRLH